MIAKSLKQLFSVYAPDCEAQTANSEIWRFKESANYSTSGFDQVKRGISDLTESFWTKRFLCCAIGIGAAVCQSIKFRQDSGVAKSGQRCRKIQGDAYSFSLLLGVCFPFSRKTFPVIFRRITPDNHAGVHLIIGFHAIWRGRPTPSWKIFPVFFPCYFDGEQSSMTPVTLVSKTADPQFAL